MNDTNSFNEELMKMLQESYEQDNVNIETCLISDETLEDNHVKLECNHKFNYKHIYNEVHKQKTKPWHSEVNKVKNSQLKCPYCRNIQTGILPYRESYPKVKYVNWPPSFMMLPDECTYIFASGKRKGQPCSKKCSGKYCISHNAIILRREKKKLEKEKIKIKLEFLEEKINTNDQSIIPHAANANAFTNVQIEQIIDTTTPLSIDQVLTCAYIFKKGKNKGETCQCKKIHQNGLCKFHYKKYKQSLEKKKTQLEKVNQNIKIKTIKYNPNQNLVITI
jgi:hypothetical protein